MQAGCEGSAILRLDTNLIASMSGFSGRAGDLQSTMGSRVSTLEKGREDILAHVAKEVEAVRAAELEREKERQARLDGLQKLVDASTERRRGEMLVVEERVGAMEAKFSRQEEAFEKLVDDAGRELKKSIEGKMTASARQMVQEVEGELRQELERCLSGSEAVERSVAELQAAAETLRKGVEHKFRALSSKVDEESMKMLAETQQIKDDALTLSETLLRRIDELDAMVHTTRAQLKQSFSECVDRDQGVESRVHSLEQHLLYNSSDVLSTCAEAWGPSPASAQDAASGMRGGGKGVLGRMEAEIERLKEQVPEVRRRGEQGGEERHARSEEARARVEQELALVAEKVEVLRSEGRGQWEALVARQDNDNKAVWEELGEQRGLAQSHLAELQALVRAEAAKRADALAAMEGALRRASGTPGDVSLEIVVLRWLPS